MATIDWKKETNNNPVYPSGTYKVQCQSFERVKASTGTPQVRWKVAILEPEEHNGRTLLDHTALTERALWRVANLVSGFGVDTTKLDKMDTDTEVFDQVCQACVGRTAYWRNEESQDNNGNPKNNIVSYVRDPKQSILEFESGLDVPDFVK